MKLYRITNLIIFFLILPVCVFAQQTRTITGHVFDEYGEPVIGASIVVEGTSIGAVSYLDGDFIIQVPVEYTTLLISYIGYRQEVVQLTEQSHYRITMREDYQILDEVVISGMGFQARKAVTGFVSSVASASVSKSRDKKSKGTWKRSGMADNSIRLEVGDDNFLPLEAAQMAVQVDGFRVRVMIDCFFYNDKGEGLEGNFKLSLPTGASPYYFAFGETEYINEEDEYDDDDNPNYRRRRKRGEIPFVDYNRENFNLSYEDMENSDLREWDEVKAARIISKQRAAKAYEQTLSARIDPALMEWGGADMFTCRVYPLSNHTLHQIVIGYDLDMTEALDLREYIMTLPKTEKNFRLDVSVYSSKKNTPVIKPEMKGSETRENYLYFSAMNPKVKEYKITYNNIEPIILFDSQDDKEDDDSYFAVNYRIELPEEQQQGLASDAVFLLDLSLSSNPDKFNVWLTLIEEILSKNRDIIKRFAVLCFNVDNYWYAPYYVSNNYYNMSRFFEYANTLALEGATDLSGALKEGSNPYWLKENSSKHIFLMSDADCNWGETNRHSFRYLLNQGDRIHTYKTGLQGTNASILDYLSRISGGYSFTVTGEEEAALTARSFRYKPWVIEDIQMEDVEDFLISGQPVQLYNGQKLIFTGRGMSSGNIYIRVSNGSQTKELRFSAKEKIGSVLTPRIYGQIAMSYLENYGFKAEEATINYSTFYSIPGQYTSFLMLEDESDYDEIAIDFDDAGYYVRDNLVVNIIKELEEKEADALLGNPKADFIAWLRHLESEDSVIHLKTDEAFWKYIENLPEEIFRVKLISGKYRLKLREEQTSEEKRLLSDEDLRFDNIFTLAKKRRKQFNKYDGMKLLSSVVERNAGDLTAIRDIAMTAIEWKMGDQAYYLMKRIIDWREGEALAYKIAAEALASMDNKIDLAFIYYYICIHADWDTSYGSFDVITALECLKYIESLESDPETYITESTRSFMRLFKKEIQEVLENEDLLFSEADIVIVVNWNLDNTDVDLHVLEPTGEECYYGNDETEIGGRLTIDVTNGYGPEMYVLEKAPDGIYKIQLKYFSDSGTRTASKAKAFIDIYQDWGRRSQKHIRKTILLQEVREKSDVLTFKIGK